MGAINSKRVWLGALAGAAVWSVWTGIVTMGILTPTYHMEQGLGHILTRPRFGTEIFFLSWALVILLVSGIGAWLYAELRVLLGAGAWTAIKIGVVLGFVAGVPINLSMVTWTAVTAKIPLFWMIDVWGGAILATSAAAFVYKDQIKPIAEIKN